MEYSRRKVLALITGATAEVLLAAIPVVTRAQSPEKPSSQLFIPLWAQKGYPHLDLADNGPIIGDVGNGFNLDPHILLSILLMESPQNTQDSESGAEGAFQRHARNQKRPYCQNQRISSAHQHSKHTPT